MVVDMCDDEIADAVAEAHLVYTKASDSGCASKKDLACFVVVDIVQGDMSRINLGDEFEEWFVVKDVWKEKFLELVFAQVNNIPGENVV